MGFSLLSLAEVIYFFTMRLIFDIYQKNTHVTPAGNNVEDDKNDNYVEDDKKHWNRLPEKQTFYWIIIS